MKKLNRREFVQTTTAATVAAAAVPRTLFGQAPTVMTPKSVKPVVVASSNGHKFKNGGTQTCVEKAFSMITGGADVLDALIAGVNIVELDPTDDSVGYGGLPNADGIVQLDSCCMHGPKKRAGGVAEIEGVRTPSKVAQLVMDETDHHLLVGKGAQENPIIAANFDDRCVGGVDESSSHLACIVDEVLAKSPDGGRKIEVVREQQFRVDWIDQLHSGAFVTEEYA